MIVYVSYFRMKDSVDSLTRRQLAERWGVHEMTIKRWERDGRLSPRRYGPRTIRYPLAYVLQLEETR